MYQVKDTLVDQKALAELKKKLPPRYAQVVSERTGKSIPLIYKVLAGTARNIEVLECLFALADETEARKEKIKNMAKSIANGRG